MNGGLGLVGVGADGAVDYEPGWLASDNSFIAPTDDHLLCDGTTGWNTWTPSAGTQENVPITCVTWQEAYAFCIWDGGFLPSQA